MGTEAPLRSWPCTRSSALSPSSIHCHRMWACGMSSGYRQRSHVSLIGVHRGLTTGTSPGIVGAPGPCESWRYSASCRVAEPQGGPGSHCWVKRPGNTWSGAANLHVQLSIRLWPSPVGTLTCWSLRSKSVFAFQIVQVSNRRQIRFAPPVPTYLGVAPNSVIEHLGPDGPTRYV